jgi:nucleotide-binding universal stress UspA family protein
MSQADSTPLSVIAVATDHSEVAATAASWAANLAKTRGAQLLLLRAFDPTLPLLPVDGAVPMPPSLLTDLEGAARIQLTQTAMELEERVGIPVKAIFGVGSAARCIIDMSLKNGAEVIVAGTRGLGGFTHALLGSTAERLVRYSPVPVITIHPDKIARRGNLKRILLPTGFTTHSENAFEAACHVLGLEPNDKDCSIILLHAYHLPIEFTSLASAVPMLPGYIADAVTNAQKRLQEDATQLRELGYNVETVASEGYPPEVIIHEAKAHNVGLIAMHTHGYHGINHILQGSSAERVSHTADCPVLTIWMGEEE